MNARVAVADVGEQVTQRRGKEPTARDVGETVRRSDGYPTALRP